MRWIVVPLVVFVLVARSDIGHAGLPLPSLDQAPVVNVEYRVEPYCAIPFQVGNTWWGWDGVVEWPPPILDPFVPYAVPGRLVVFSDDRALFTADVNGARLWLTRLHGERTAGGCA